MSKQLDDLIEALKAKGEALGDARAHASQLEDQRPILKEMAIIRVMERDKISSHAAKDIVKTDVAYMEHRTVQRAAGIALCRAEAEYEAAKAAATQASLITPSMIELQLRITVLEKDLRQAKRETDLKQVVLRKANGYLADRIRDVDELTRINRNLSAQLEVEPRKVPLTLDSLEQSRGSLVGEGA